MKFLDKIIIICGPTASGKSGIAIKVAELTDGVIINADAIQVYKDIPILSAGPSKEDKEVVEHRLYAFLDVDQNYSVANWLEDVCQEIDDVLAQKKTPILVGGTGMYITSLINGIREIGDVKQEVQEQTIKLIEEKGSEYLYNKLIEIDEDTKDYVRPSDQSRIGRLYNVYLSFGLSPTEYRNLPNKKFYEKEKFMTFFINKDREELYKDAEDRFEKMLAAGAVDEVKKLLDLGYDENSYIAKAIGYKEIVNYLKNNISKEDMLDAGKQATRNYIKRQFTWFRNQLDNIEESNILDAIKNHLQ